MSDVSSPSAVVDRQTSAYNERDIDAYCALFADDVVLRTLHKPGAPVVHGVAALRPLYARVFATRPQLHCVLKTRTALGAWVIDHEVVTGLLDRPLHAIAIYEVRGGLIRSLNILEPDGVDPVAGE